MPEDRIIEHECNVYIFILSHFAYRIDIFENGIGCSPENSEAGPKIFRIWSNLNFKA